MLPRLGFATVRGLGMATFLLLGMGVFAPRPAAATCGDYLMVGGHAGGSSAAHQMPSTTDPERDAARTPADDNAEPGQNRPCRGATCSNGSHPPAAPAPRLEVAPDRWLIASRDDDGRPPFDPALRLRGTTAKPVVGFEVELLRPPRS